AENEVFSIYPNPSRGVFNVRFGSLLPYDTEVTIFDASGRKVKAQTFEKDKQEFVVDIQGVSKGIYLIRFNQNGASYSRTVVIE
ncbi:T9SS type A sorting domain-containing protein, partial [Bernardetia sp.]|uniref:T9SS type A sorting domain-containing protein n=1 Tax=Bernardetia sp. TaxID=1937974 RepID=UPI0025BA09EE